MNIEETSAVLARVQAYHQGFKVPDSKILAWHELLEPYTYADCIEAVKDYFRNPGDWIMPSDIIERVKGYRAKRLQEMGGYLHLTIEDEAAALEAGTYSEQIAELHRMARDGHITKPEYDAYQRGTLALSYLHRKEIGR